MLRALRSSLSPVPSAIHRLYAGIFRLWRERRHALFMREIAPARDDVLLDVGGYPWVWTTRPQPVRMIDALNIHDVPWDAAAHPGHDIRLLTGDGCALPMPDGSYDIVFSNSVIEHVGSWERQRQFAAEVRRVGRAVWVQTPAYECPVEPHYLAPFVHWLPRAWQSVVVRWLTPRGWIERPTREAMREMVETTRLLRRREMAELFPDCDIITERLLGVFPKSYIAVRRGDAVGRAEIVP